MAAVRMYDDIVRHSKKLERTERGSAGKVNDLEVMEGVLTSVGTPFSSLSRES